MKSRYRVYHWRSTPSSSRVRCPFRLMSPEMTVIHLDSCLTFPGSSLFRFDGNSDGGSVVSLKFDPSRFGCFWNRSVHSHSFAGIHGHVVVVVLNGKDLVSIPGRRYGCAFEEGDVLGRVVKTNFDVFITLACSELGG